MRTLHFSQEEKIQRFPANKSSRNLQDDLNDFLALIPLDEIANIVLNYVANGAEVQAALQYLVSEEFESIVVFGDHQPELYNSSDMKPANQMRSSSRSLKSTLNEILAIVPVDEFKALYYETVQTSADIAELINRPSSGEFRVSSNPFIPTVWL
ncbi:uncharacterized protein LOC126187603 [Schistocerca cancellata]|uniref:uncharacterized protein LOC126187603 n=1 Tax=Schistocerca cancellata TaxID=274614 RepID=UPI002118AA45|nr:uncharacterized protein LOC126187603 [Schistocerca cancellata]